MIAHVVIGGYHRRGEGAGAREQQRLPDILAHDRFVWRYRGDDEWSKVFRRGKIKGTGKSKSSKSLRSPRCKRLLGHDGGHVDISPLPLWPSSIPEQVVKYDDNGDHDENTHHCTDDYSDLDTGRAVRFRLTKVRFIWRQRLTVV